MSSSAKAIAGLIAVAAAVGLFIALSSGSDDDGSDSATAVSQQTSTGADDPVVAEQDKPEGSAQPKPEEPEKPDVPTIVIKGGQPVGGVQKLSFESGDAIRFIVESDVDEHVHFHGYDVTEDVTAGGRVEFDVPATLEGVFEVELEDSVVPIAEISVNPA